MKKRRSTFIHPPYLRFSDIRIRADEFRKRYLRPPDLLPVPIEKIAEITLGLIPIPIHGLLDEEDVDGFLTNNLKNICIDFDIYMDPRKENRRRFTYAHEVGHLILHRDEIQQCNFRTPEDWKHFHEDFLKEDMNWFEQHAYEFAGRLLVPKTALESELKAYSVSIEKYRKMGGNDAEIIAEVIAHDICSKFKVSPECMSKRIQKEKLLLPFLKRT